MASLPPLTDSLSAQPFRKKLTLATLAVTAIALLMSCVGLIGVQYTYDRGKADEQNRQLAEVLATNLGAAVVFGDTETANIITHSARRVPSVVAIEARDSAGNRISLYHEKAVTLNEAQQRLTDAKKHQPSYFDELGSYSTPIAVNDDEVGKLVVLYRYRSLGLTIADMLPVATVLFIVCLAIGVSVANVLKKMIFRPLDGLTHSMQAVRQSGNLQERVEMSNDEDFDQIITSYNAMLDDIEARTDELSIAMDQLAVARDEAERANIAKSAFLANMSHELRTPLNAIIGYAEVLRDDLTAAGLERSIEDIGWIYSSSKQLLELINSLLDLSKIEAGKMDLDVHAFDLRKLLREVEATLQPLADKQNNQFSVQLDETIGLVRSDSTKLRQCLLNLGSNACKFTENGFVQLSARVEGDELIFELSDTGIGMSEEDLSRLFQPFTQSDSSTTRRFGGTGLGLALVKRFTEMLGGSIEVSSDVGFGTTFTMRLKQNISGLQKAKASTAGAAEPATDIIGPPPRAERKKPLALVMEDEPSAVELLRRLLDRNGYQCVVAGDGQRGIDMAREQEPDIVLLDIAMPVLDGWSVLDSFSSDESLRAIPTIVVSVDDRTRLTIERGASDHLVKPVDTDDLETILQFYSDKRTGHILLVEDDPATARLYENGLTQCGFQVSRASNGAEAVALLADDKFAMVVTDLMMPTADGFQLIEHIGTIPLPERPPVIVVTGASLEEPQKRDLEAKVEEVHLKSGLTPRHLANKISNLLDV